MKKLLRITALAILLAMLLAYLKSDEENRQKVQQAIEDEENEIQLQQETQLVEMQKQATIHSTVNVFYFSQNGMLPVYAKDWKPIADIPYQDWHYAKEQFNSLGTTYKKMYEQINGVCANWWIFRTGFYKSEFDEIRTKLAQRANW